MYVFQCFLISLFLSVCHPFCFALFACSFAHFLFVLEQQRCNNRTLDANLNYYKLVFIFAGNSERLTDYYVTVTSWRTNTCTRTYARHLHQNESAKDGEKESETVHGGVERDVKEIGRVP